MAERDDKPQRLYAALLELVECKDLKEATEVDFASDDPVLTTEQRNEQRAEYNRRKPLAWENARKVLVECVPSAVAATDHGMLAAQLRGIAEHLRSVPEYRKLRGDADIIERAMNVLHSLPSATGDTVAVPRDLLNAAACAINRDRWACNREADTEGEQAMSELHDQISHLLLSPTSTRMKP